MANSLSPAARAADTITDISTNFDGTSPISDSMPLIEALTRSCLKHGGHPLELLPVTLDLSNGKVTIFAAHFKTSGQPDAFAVAIHNLTDGEYTLLSSGDKEWEGWLTDIIDEVMKETNDLLLQQPSLKQSGRTARNTIRH